MLSLLSELLLDALSKKLSLFSSLELSVEKTSYFPLLLLDRTEDKYLQATEELGAVFTKLSYANLSYANILRLIYPLKRYF